MESIPYLYPILGGVLIGLGASLLLLANGKSLGFTGILKSIFRFPGKKLRLFQVMVLAGTLVGGVIIGFIKPESLPDVGNINLPLVALAGFLMGIGSHFAGGCTSTHGFCGTGRGDKDSIIAVIIFMITAAITVNLMS